MTAAAWAGLASPPVLSPCVNHAVRYSLGFCENLTLLLGLLRANPVCRGKLVVVSPGEAWISTGSAHKSWGSWVDDHAQSEQTLTGNFEACNIYDKSNFRILLGHAFCRLYIFCLMCQGSPRYLFFPAGMQRVLACAKWPPVSPHVILMLLTDP